MVPLTSLWLPILLSAVFAFMLSNLLHMVLPYHKGDYRSMPSEDDVQAALRKFNIPLCDYMLPRAGSMSASRAPKGPSWRSHRRAGARRGW